MEIKQYFCYSNYQTVCVASSCFFTQVYQCFCEDTGVDMAAKVIEIHPNTDEKVPTFLHYQFTIVHY